MIYVDRRTGSIELKEPLEKLGVQVYVDTLEYGDVFFAGEGPNGVESIAIERKCLGDLIQSMRSGRLSGHQLPGLMTTYDRVYLMVEGEWQPDKDGFIEEFKYGRWRPYKLGQSQITYLEPASYLNTLEMVAGVRVQRTLDINESAHYIRALWRSWQKGWGEHKALSALHMKNVLPSGAAVHWEQPSLLRRVAAQLPGIGTERSEAVEAAFSDCVSMVNADPKQWMEIDGVGKGIASKVWKALRS